MSKNNRLRKIILRTVIAIVLIFFAGLTYAGNYFCNYALSRNGGGEKRNVKSSNEIIADNDLISKNKKKIQDEIDSEVFNFSEISIEHNNLKLVSEFLKFSDFAADNKLTLKDNKEHNYALLLHGYHSNVTSMFKYAEHYLKNSYNVLIPHMRAHGKSEGQYIGMGATDRDDVIAWINKLNEIDPEAKIIIHGVSMGAATAMNVSGMNPESVVAVIEDCGYSSIYDIFSSELKKRFNLPSFPLLDTCELITKIKASYDFHSIIPVTSLQKTHLPILFIHGEDDDFVPFSMLDINYDNCASSEKEKLAVPHAGHADAIFADPTLYWQTVDNFLNKYNK